MTDAMKPGEPYADVPKYLLADWVMRLKNYIQELEAVYVSEFQTTRETPEECLERLRRQYGVLDLFAENASWPIP